MYINININEFEAKESIYKVYRPKPARVELCG